jgi:hypothetical protein
MADQNFDPFAAIFAEGSAGHAAAYMGNQGVPLHEQAAAAKRRAEARDRIAEAYAVAERDAAKANDSETKRALAAVEAKQAELEAALAEQNEQPAWYGDKGGVVELDDAA